MCVTDLSMSVCVCVCTCVCVIVSGSCCKSYKRLTKMKLSLTRPARGNQSKRVSASTSITFYRVYNACRYEDHHSMQGLRVAVDRTSHSYLTCLVLGTTCLFNILNDVI